ncbi:leucine-rich repeat flightless-interacting protein 1 isoform X10 [Hemicordylus capensis]|uniref:leucine-rich repeat flightless-interacting protein 1 isoform X10 n=1 Tax=Hemicordylus capensis TaxID=884348 RepID=UPI002302C8A4|nr:leucine-rich repeat flightless-interacting protein 1 isoform X10 [Hemicordylus capensis]
MQTEAECFSPDAQILAEARLAAKRAARAEAREIRMKELERQQKEIYQVQKKYYGLDTKFGDIEQWMEDSERYTHKSRRNASASDEDERMSVGSRGSLRTDLEYASTCPVAGLEKERTKRMNFRTTNGYEEDMYGSSQSRKSSRPSLLYSDALPARSYRASLYDENFNSGSRRYSASSSRPPSEYSCYLGSGSRASSRASSARASPVVEERPEKDFEKGVRTVSSLSAATLASLGGTSSRRGSGDTSISVDTEASIREIREIKDISDLKDQIQDVEGKYMQGLKEMKDSLAEVEEKYKKAMVSNAQLDNEKTNFMYQVDTLKDALLELEEQLAESRRQYEEKNKDFEREKHAHTVLQFQFMEVKETLKQREELLAEIRQLQQKQESYVREISDLQETIEWKEKKIGALERQKEFFDSIRSERDDLREEVIVLKEQLKQHGIIFSSEVATNGETSVPLDKDGFSPKIVPETSHALKEVEDDILGRANEVEMKNEILENVGKREILQNTEHEEHTEDTKEQEIVQECSEIKTLHADENAEAEKIIEGKVASTLILNSGLEEPAKSHSEHVPGIVDSLENSDVVELRSEAGLLGNTTEVEESDRKDVEHGNIVSKTGNQSKVACLGIETNQEIIAGLEMLPQQQGKEMQKDTLADEAEGNNNEVFQEALDFVINSQRASSSQPELLEDILTKAPSSDSNTELRCNAKENTESKVADLEEDIEGEEDIKITSKAEWDKNEPGNEESDTENVIQEEQETKVVAEQAEMTSPSEYTPDEFVEEQKQVEMEEIQFLASKHDPCVEEEQHEQETGGENNPEKSSIKENDQKEALLGELCAHSDSEKKNEQDAVKDTLHTEETAGDDVSHNECQAYEESNVDIGDNSRKCKEINSEFIDDKTLANASTHKVVTYDSQEEEEEEEEYSPAQERDWLVEEQNVNKQDKTVHELARATTINMDTIEVHKGNQEENCEKTEKEVCEVVPDTKAAACLNSQKAELSDQEENPNSEEEVAVEEYHEAFDFEESRELKTTERSDSQDNEEERNNDQVQERDDIAESAVQNVIKEDYEEEYMGQEKVEENIERKYLNLEDEVINEGTLTEGDENINQEKGEKSEEGQHLQTDSLVSESSKPPCELLEDSHEKLIDKTSIKPVATAYTLEQLERLESSVDASEEETQVGRKGKGKSRDDCVLS